MPEVQVRKGEPVDRALKRLKTKLEMEGILEEVRRLRAHEIAGIKTIRADVVSAEELDDVTLGIQAIVENLQRADITPLEEAAASEKGLALARRLAKGKEERFSAKRAELLSRGVPVNIRR